VSAPPPPPGTRVVVAGVGVTGFAAADALLDLGALVTVLDDRDDDDARERATILEVLGADVRLGEPAVHSLPQDVDLVVASPGWRPASPLLGQAGARGVPVWGEVELAWRLRPLRADGTAAPWLAVTGTNGKTTTVQMLAAMLQAAGLRTTAAGNVGTPVITALRHPEPYDVLAVELSSFQLHAISSLSAQAAVVLNVAPDHLDWHGSYEAYRADKGRIYQRAQVACVYPLADPGIEALVRNADVVEGCRAIGITAGIPPVGSVGVVDDVLADRAFVDNRRTAAAELATVDDVRPLAPHTLMDALAAAALARAHGVPPAAVRDGLRAFRPDAHRITEVAADAAGVRWIDDSKATNPHAAEASLQAFDPVVWVAGGLAKGATFDGLVQAVRPRLRGVVLIGVDRRPLSEALRRHAPDVPVIEVDDGETGLQVMDRAVAAASRLMRPGDTVLLAPACASQDQFRDYGARGDAFAAAVRSRAAAPPSG
jgi:UDP-N-acetylmuramoylalanine--D-glutamate ligase